MTSTYKQLSLGQSVNAHDILAYTNHDNAKSYLYLMAGVHGDEPESVFVLTELFKWLQNQTLTLPIIVIPTLNPDGLAAKTRVNANQVDLNRNWPTSDWTEKYNGARYFPGKMPLSEPENIALSKLFGKFPPKLIITFHSWKEAVLDHNKQALAVAEYIANYNHYKVTDNIGYPTPGSLGKYADENLKCGILTYELPEANSSKPMQQIWGENEEGLKKYIFVCNSGV